MSTNNIIKLNIFTGTQEVFLFLGMLSDAGWQLYNILWYRGTLHRMFYWKQSLLQSQVLNFDLCFINAYE